nr:hypothetical protein [uncultured Sphingosinicella sp.]
MRYLMLAAGAALTLSACGGGGETETTTVNTTTMDANATATDNMMMDPNMSMNGADMNGAAMNGTMDANMTADPATQNMIQQDMNTNSPDTNLANGL